MVRYRSLFYFLLNFFKGLDIGVHTIYYTIQSQTHPIQNNKNDKTKQREERREKNKKINIR